MSDTGGSHKYATSYEDWTIKEASEQFYALFSTGMEHHMMANYIKSILERRYGGLLVEVNYPVGPYKKTPLSMAIQTGNLQVVEVLLKFDADPNLCNKCDQFDSNNIAPLHLAVCNYECGLEMMGLLLKYGASVYSVDSSQETILHYICKNHRTDLSKHSSSLVVDKLFKLGLVIENIDPVRLKEMLNYQNLDGAIPLHTAISYHRCDLAAELIGEGSDVNIPNNMGYSSLNWAVLNLRNDESSYESGEVFTSEFLVENMIHIGANLETRTNSGKTPLFTSINPSKDGFGTEPPKMWAIQFLLHYGANLYNENNEGVSPWSSADRQTQDEISLMLRRMEQH
jgi:ankyrin repeat protein